MSAGAATADAWVAAHLGRDVAREPAWLVARRQEALERFRALGWPSRRAEAWRTLDLGTVTGRAFAPAPAGRDPDALLAHRAAPAGPGGETARLVLVNGRLDAARSRLDGLPLGARFVGLADALAEGAAGKGATRDAGGVAGRHLGERLGGATEPHAFAALSLALFQDGALLDVAEGVRVDGLVHLVHVAVGGEAAEAAHARVLVRLGRGARVALVETFLGSAPAAWITNVAAEVVLEEGARLDHLRVEREAPGAFHVGLVDAVVGRDARYDLCALLLGAGTSRTEVTVRLDGPGAATTLDGLYVVDGPRHADVVTRVDHAVPHGTSRQLFKGILDDRATSSFQGGVLVRRDAQQTDARQSNRNLLLSREAVADTKPELEIFADDVKCAHGATVGQLEEEPLFYLRTRGIEEAEARRILVGAFAAEVPSHVEHPALREAALAALAPALAGRARTGTASAAPAEAVP